MSKVVKITRVFKTDVETMFDLWTRPEHIKRWHRPRPTDYSTPEATVDLRIGGEFQIVMQDRTGRHTVGGQFTRIDRPTELAYTWQWQGQSEVSEVRLTFKPVPDGTEVTLVHEHPDNTQMAELHQQGWEGCLAVLETITNLKQ